VFQPQRRFNAVFLTESVSVTYWEVLEPNGGFGVQ
jgi:hypothetical protein